MNEQITQANEQSEIWIEKQTINKKKIKTLETHVESLRKTLETEQEKHQSLVCIIQINLFLINLSCRKKIILNWKLKILN